MPRNQWSTSSFRAVDLNFPFYESVFATMVIWVLGECIYCFTFLDMCIHMYYIYRQGGPLPVISEVMTPISRAITPVMHS